MTVLEVNVVVLYPFLLFRKDMNITQHKPMEKAENRIQINITDNIKVQRKSNENKNTPLKSNIQLDFVVETTISYAAIWNILSIYIYTDD